MGLNPIYIDAGAHNGSTVRRFQATHPGHVCYAFEPNPNYKAPDDLDCTWIRAAVWTEDGTIPLYLAHQDQGTTVLKGKRTAGVDYTKSVEVKSVDLDRWIQEELPADATVTLRLNVEGAGYPVLRKMLEGGSIHRLERLMVEFHDTKIEGFKASDTSGLLGELATLNLQVEQLQPGNP